MTEFWNYLTLPWLIEGMWFTLQLTVMGFVGGAILGLGLAAIQLTRFPLLVAIGRAYTVLYRGTPLILQLVFVFTALPHIGISFPPLIAGGVALALNEAAFFAEIFRSGVRGVDPGQINAAKAVGLAPTGTMRRVIAPQAIRSMVPALGSEGIATMKNSALASVIAVPELTLRTQQLASATFDYFEIYFATAVLYLLLTGALTLVQIWIEDVLNLDRSRSRSFIGRLRRRTPDAGIQDSADVPIDMEAIEKLWARRAQPRLALTGKPVVAVTAVHQAYGDNQVLKGVNLNVRKGEVVALLGPSGGGKSTLLRTINQLERIDSGHIQVGDVEVVPPRGVRDSKEASIAQSRRESHVGMVFQSFNLFQHLSAQENVAAPLVWLGRATADEAAQTASALLERVGLAEHAHKLPKNLSGGQQQRVGIARALALQPRVLLLDEPTSALDPELVAEVLSVIRTLAEEDGLTMIIATHQLRFAREVADTVAFMAGGQIAEIGPAAQVIDHPTDPRAQRFMAAMAIAAS